MLRPDQTFFNSASNTVQSIFSQMFSLTRSEAEMEDQLQQILQIMQDLYSFLG